PLSGRRPAGDHPRHPLPGSLGDHHGAALSRAPRAGRRAPASLPPDARSRPVDLDLQPDRRRGRVAQLPPGPGTAARERRGPEQPLRDGPPSGRTAGHRRPSRAARGPLATLPAPRRQQVPPLPRLAPPPAHRRIDPPAVVPRRPRSFSRAGGGRISTFSGPPARSAPAPPA